MLNNASPNIEPWGNPGGLNKPGGVKCNMPYFDCKGEHILNLFLRVIVNNMAAMRAAIEGLSVHPQNKFDCRRGRGRLFRYSGLENITGFHYILLDFNLWNKENLTKASCILVRNFLTALRDFKKSFLFFKYFLFFPCCVHHTINLFFGNVCYELQ